jgi:hypothetical protein
MHACGVVCALYIAAAAAAAADWLQFILHTAYCRVIVEVLVVNGFKVAESDEMNAVDWLIVSESMLMYSIDSRHVVIYNI